MGQGHNFQKFKAAILAQSISQDWDEAKAEWELHIVYHDATDRACECGHQPIHQICMIKNRDNANELEVGNVCVNKFMRLFSNRIFAVLKRVEAEPTKSLNPAALDLFRHRGVIDHSEEQDYLGYWRKRTNMTNEQRAQKTDINARVLAYVASESARLAAKFRAAGLI